MWDEGCGDKPGFELDNRRLHRVSWRRKGEQMNLSLGLADGLTGLRQRGGGVESSIARFQQWMTVPDSPIRAIRRQAAREGEYADIPEAVGPVVRRMLAAREIGRAHV